MPTMDVKKEKGLMPSLHDIEFDGKTLYIDKGSETQGVFAVDEYTYNESMICNGEVKQSQYIITATEKDWKYKAHNISLTIGEYKGKTQYFVTLPMITNTNELGNVITMYGFK